MDEKTAKLLFKLATSKPEWEVALCAALLAFSTGMRGGEIKTLLLGDLHPDDPEPHLRIRPEAEKSRRGRQVPQNEGARWVVRTLHERSHLVGCCKPEHFLFLLDASKRRRKGNRSPQSAEGGYDPTAHQVSWASAWRSLRKAAGIPWFRFHDLRHTFVSAAAEAGVPIPVIREIVGHMSTEMMLHYTHAQTRQLPMHSSKTFASRFRLLRASRRWCCLHPCREAWFSWCLVRLWAADFRSSCDPVSPTLSP